LDVFDWNGTVLMSNGETQQWVDQPARDVPLVREVLARDRPGTVETAGPDGVARIYGFDRLEPPPSGAHVYVVVGLPAALERADRERQEQEVLRRENFELEQRNGAVEEANRLKTEFVSMVTHELRTPLTSVLGYVDLLLDGEAGELAAEQREYLTIVKNNA